jgi:nucleoside-diphosphate-sugar epimerase
MRTVVTGAGGFVGANLVRELLSRGHDVIAVVRPGNQSWRLAGLVGELQIAELDLTDRDAITLLIARQRPTVVFHLAAHGAYSWQKDLTYMLAVNVAATEVILQAALSVGATVINAGSSSEYGAVDHPPRESELVRPNSYYAISKVAATHLCQLAAARHGLRAATLRLYSVYGPWEEPGRLMPTLVRSCRGGEWPPLVDPSIARDFVWVGDVCDAFIRAAEVSWSATGSVLNIASGTQTTLGQLVDLAATVFSIGKAPDWGTMPSRDWDTSIWVGDPSRARQEIGWTAGTSLSDGLALLSAWFDGNPDSAGRYE